MMAVMYRFRSLSLIVRCNDEPLKVEELGIEHEKAMIAELSIRLDCIAL